MKGKAGINHGRAGHVTVNDNCAGRLQPLNLDRYFSPLARGRQTR